MSAIIPAACLAGVLAMASASLGVVIARTLWAEDLRHAQQLRTIWDKTEASYKEHIRILQTQLEQRIR